MNTYCNFAFIVCLNEKLATGNGLLIVFLFKLIKYSMDKILTYLWADAVAKTWLELLLMKIPVTMSLDGV